MLKFRIPRKEKKRLKKSMTELDFAMYRACRFASQAFNECNTALGNLYKDPEFEKGSLFSHTMHCPIGLNGLTVEIPFVDMTAKYFYPQTKRADGPLAVFEPFV